MTPLHPIIEAQCFIAGCMLHRCGYNLASPIAIVIASDLHKPLPDRKFLGGWGDAAAVWDVDITDAEGLEQMMERAAPVLAALHQGMVLGPTRIANHMRALFDRGDIDFWGAMLLYQNCVPFMRDGRGVSTRAKRVMRELLDEIINEPDAQVERFASLAAEADHVTKGWTKHRLRGNAVAPVVELRYFFLEIMQSLAGALQEISEQGDDEEEATCNHADSTGAGAGAASTAQFPASTTLATPSREVPEQAPTTPSSQGRKPSSSSDSDGCVFLVVVALIGVAAYLFWR